MAQPPNRPTMKQQNARRRNWRIFQLRGLQWQLYGLRGDRRSRVIDIIDEELRDLDAMNFDQHKRKLQ